MARQGLLPLKFTTRTAGLQEWNNEGGGHGGFQHSRIPFFFFSLFAFFGWLRAGSLASKTREFAALDFTNETDWGKPYTPIWLRRSRRVGKHYQGCLRKRNSDIIRNYRVRKLKRKRHAPLLHLGSFSFSPFSISFFILWSAFLSGFLMVWYPLWSHAIRIDRN
jgi:hypothetical protein